MNILYQPVFIITVAHGCNIFDERARKRKRKETVADAASMDKTNIFIQHISVSTCDTDYIFSKNIH